MNYQLDRILQKGTNPQDNWAEKNAIQILTNV